MLYSVVGELTQSSVIVVVPLDGIAFEVRTISPWYLLVMTHSYQSLFANIVIGYCKLGCNRLLLTKHYCCTADKTLLLLKIYPEIPFAH